MLVSIICYDSISVKLLTYVLQIGFLLNDFLSYMDFLIMELQLLNGLISSGFGNSQFNSRYTSYDNIYSILRSYILSVMIVYANWD